MPFPLKNTKKSYPEINYAISSGTAVLQEFCLNFYAALLDDCYRFILYYQFYTFYLLLFVCVITNLHFTEMQKYDSNQKTLCI